MGSFTETIANYFHYGPRLVKKQSFFNGVPAPAMDKGQWKK